MSSTSPGYGITIRVEGAPERQPVAQATTAITNAGAAITALDVAESSLEHHRCKARSGYLRRDREESWFKGPKS